MVDDTCIIGSPVKDFNVSYVGREFLSPNDLLAVITVCQERLAYFLVVEVTYAHIPSRRTPNV